MTWPTLSDDHYKAIGRLIVCGTQLESIILDLIRIFLQSRSIVNVVLAFSHQQATSNLDTLKALCTLGLSEEEVKEYALAGLLDEARVVFDFRNTVVHAHWTIDEKGETLAVRYQARGKFSRSRRPISATEILAKADEGARLEELLRGLRDHLLDSNPDMFEEKYARPEE